MRIEQDNGFTQWDVPGCLMALTIYANGSGVRVDNPWNGPINEGRVSRLSAGRYRVVHNLGHDAYVPMAISAYRNNTGANRWNYIVNVVEKTNTYFTLQVTDNKDNIDDCTLYVSMFGMNNFKME